MLNQTTGSACGASSSSCFWQACSRQPAGFGISIARPSRPAPAFHGKRSRRHGIHRRRPNPTRADYESLVGYLVEGFLTYATPSHALRNIRGCRPAGHARPRNSKDSVASRRCSVCGSSTKPCNAAEAPVGRECRRGADPEVGHPGRDRPEHTDYWGDITDRDQRIAEAADIALALWLSRVDGVGEARRVRATADRCLAAAGERQEYRRQQLAPVHSAGQRGTSGARRGL